VSRSDRERREAERAARRAKRLADRADQRAQRKGEQARRASERAEELAERAYRRTRPSDRDLDRSIEDFVDDVTEKWSKKAEDWIDGQSRKMFEQDEDNDPEGLNSAEVEAKRARRAAESARRAAEKAAAYAGFEDEPRKRSRSRTRRGKSKRQRYRPHEFDFDFGRWGRNKRRRRGFGLYRDTRNKKVCGVCSGTAEYLGVQTWQVRLGAVFGLIFVPSIAVPAYFITYFLMDKKPYYREMTDKYVESHPEQEEVRPMRKRKSQYSDSKHTVSNVQALKTAKRKFSDIEDRLRSMEGHVTSSQFELQRELKKISGDES